MNEKKSFWTSLPGILTGIAAVITAIGGILTIYFQFPKHTTPVTPHVKPSVKPLPAVPPEPESMLIETPPRPNLSQLEKEIRKNKEKQEEVVRKIKRLQGLLPRDPDAGPEIENLKRIFHQLERDMVEMENERQLLLKRGSN